MAGFYIYETYDLQITLSDPSALDDYKTVVVSLAQGKTKLNFTDPGIDEGVINVHLSQEQTALFKPSSNANKVTVQVNIYYTDTERDTSAQGFLEVYDNLYREVIS